MKQLIRACRGLVMSIAILALWQESFAQSETEEATLFRNQVSLSIGHSLIPSAEELSGSRKNLLVPTWGLSYEFSFSERFMIGLKSEIEASNYIITDENDSELEREFPVSLCLYAGYKIYKGLTLFAGPGVEFEQDENLSLVQFGALYDIELPGGWALAPEFSYELKGGHTSAYSIYLGVGKKF